MDRREDKHLVCFAQRLARRGIDESNGVDVVAEKFHLVAELLVGRIDVHRIAAHAERAALEVHVVAVVLQIHQLAEQFIARLGLAHADGRDGFFVFLRAPQSEDARNAGDDDHVPPVRQAGGGAEAQAVEVVVAGGVFFDVDVALRDVGLGLIIVVVTDEIFHGVVGKQFLELFIKLGREGFVMADDQRRPLQSLDDVGHCERLSAARDAQQDVVILVAGKVLHQPVDGSRLIAGGFHRTDDFKLGHSVLVTASMVCVETIHYTN
jgi:hypothetical protein